MCGAGFDAGCSYVNSSENTRQLPLMKQGRIRRAHTFGLTRKEGGLECCGGGGKVGGWRGCKVGESRKDLFWSWRRIFAETEGATTSHRSP